MAHTAAEACKTELQTELEELVERQEKLEPTDYTRRHMALSAAIRQLDALLGEYEEGTMEERPQNPEEPTPPPEPPPPEQPEEPKA